MESIGEQSTGHHFIHQRIAEDCAAGRYEGRVHTRFPPEPNGYLHIGHAASICLNFGMAEAFGGLCNLRFDDTNPIRETSEYAESIMEDIRWLGFDWGDRLFYASDYFEQLYQLALELVRAGKAFVCDLSIDEIRAHRGTLTEPGRESPYRDRSIEENLALFQGMRAGDFPDGSKVLRARIDMGSPNLNLRDPVMYRISRARHHRTGDSWPIYPMYDWAHGQSDSIEGITHSICTMEFEDHRPLYDWFIEQLGIHHPRQIEFARRNLSYTVMSKRHLLRLVEEGHVAGWDDPRMPTLSGMRRRGYPSGGVREFCERIGVGRRENTVDISLLEHCIRQDLEGRALRYMGVLNPIKVVIENYPEGAEEELEGPLHPTDSSFGSRVLPFSRELYIEATDFMEDPPRKFFRLGPGREVRLRYGYFITSKDVVKDPDTGAVVELRCTYDPDTRGGQAPDGRKVKGTIHWVSARHAQTVEVRLYDRLFSVSDPTDVPEGGSFLDHINPDSLTVIHCPVEPALRTLEAGAVIQFERQGYFCVDREDSRPGAPVFNRTVTLRDSWKGGAGGEKA